MLAWKGATSRLYIYSTGIVREEVAILMQWVTAILLVGLYAGLRNLDAQICNFAPNCSIS